MAEEGGQQAKIELGFEYDPKNVEAFVKQMGDVKQNLQETAGDLDKFKDGFGKLGGLLKAGAATIGGVFGLDQVIEAENLNKQFSYVFKGIEKAATETAKVLDEQFGFSFDSARAGLIDLQKELVTLGVRGQRGLDISGGILKRASEVANQTGFDFEQVRKAFEGFVLSGGKDVSQFSEIFKKDKALQQQLTKYSRQTVITGRPDAAATLRAAQTLLGASKQFEGSIARDPGLDFQKRAIKGDVADLFNKTAESLLGDAKKVAGALSRVTPHLEKFADVLGDIVKIAAVFGIGKLAKTAISKGSGLLPFFTAIFGYRAGKLLDEKFDLGDKIGTGVFKAQEAIKGGLKGGFKKFKGGIQDIIDINDESVRKRHGLPDQSSATITNNNNITINARTDDPKKMAEQLEPEIQKIAENNFRQLHEREIAQYTPAEV